MSTSTHRSRRRQSSASLGLPTWSGIAIVAAALTTGLLLSLNALAIGLAFLLCFAVSSVFVALFTEARGIYLTVAAIPSLFGIFTIATSWLIGRSMSAPGASGLSTTAIITAIYPLAQFFPWLLGVTIICILLGWCRLWLLKRSGHARVLAQMQERQRSAEANRRNLTTARRARRQSNQITVEELLARNRERSQSRAQHQKPARPAQRLRDTQPTREPRPPVASPPVSQPPVSPPPVSQPEQTHMRQEQFPAHHRQQPTARPTNPRRRLDDDLFS